MVAPAATKRLQDVFDYVKRQFGDESAVQITDDDITRWTNQCSIEIVSKNPIIKASSSTVVAGLQYLYPAPADVIQMEAVTYNGSPLQAIDFHSALQMMGEDESAQGTPSHWYMWGNDIYLWPRPSENGKTVKIYYVSKPVQVTTANDLLGLPDRYYDQLMMLVMSKAYELDQDWAAHSVQRNQFEAEMSRLNHADENAIGPYHVIRDVYGDYED